MRTSSRLPKAFALLALLIALLVAGCNSHTDKISDLLNNPSGYAGKDVTVAGEVTKIYELPLGLSNFGISNLAAYRVNDGTGQVWVVSHAGAPVVGDKVGIRGSVRPEGRIGTFPLGTIIEERGRKVR